MGVCVSCFFHIVVSCVSFSLPSGSIFAAFGIRCCSERRVALLRNITRTKHVGTVSSVGYKSRRYCGCAPSSSIC